MPSPAKIAIVSEPMLDRRFYPRAAPSSLTHVIFGPELSGELINLGENGIRLAAPFGLTNNFVCRATLPLDELERPVEACVRVIWTGEANHAGIQFMDLSDEDREQIRKWVALKKKQTASANATAVLNETIAQMEPALECASQVAAGPEPRHRKPSLRLALTVTAACVALLTATGVALWATPVRGWLTKSVFGGTKSVLAMSRSRNTTSAPVAASLPETKVIESAAPADPVATKNVPPETVKSTTSDSPATTGIVHNDSAITTKTTRRGEKSYSPKKKPILNANAIPADTIGPAIGFHANGAEAARGATEPKTKTVAPEGEIPATSNSGPTEDPGPKISAETRTGEHIADPLVPGKLKAQVSSENTERSNAASDTGQPARGSRTELQPSRPPFATGASEAAAAAPEVIETPTPTSKIIDVLLPNSPRATVVRLPGERVLQTEALTLRIERAIVAPAGYAMWSAQRKKKVLLGDLLSRVDPRAPKTAERGGMRVSVRAMVGKDGRVEKLAPVNGPSALVPGVMRAVRDWRFQPTLLDGKPLETAALITVEFGDHTAAPAPR